MNVGLKQGLFWVPRVLCILFALFLSLFALDVFGGSRGFWGTLAALLIHLVPVFFILIVLAVAWRWEWVGAVVYVGLAILYVARFWGRFAWSAYVVVAGPLVVIGVLFLLNWVTKDRLHTP